MLYGSGSKPLEADWKGMAISTAYSSHCLAVVNAALHLCDKTNRIDQSWITLGAIVRDLLRLISNH